MGEQLYCGCCGNEIGRSTRSDPNWCRRCAPHIITKRRDIAGCGLSPWERTWFAQTATDCPYQVPTLPADPRS